MEFPVISSISPSGPNASLFWAVEKPLCVLKTVPVNDHNEWLFTHLVLSLPLLSTLMCLSFPCSHLELQKVLFETAIKEQTCPKTTCCQRLGPLHSGKQRFSLQFFQHWVTHIKAVKSRGLSLEHQTMRMQVCTQLPAANIYLPLVCACKFFLYLLFLHTHGGPGVLSHSSKSTAVGWSSCMVGRGLLTLKQGSLTSGKTVWFKADLILIENIQTIFTWIGI